MTVSPPFENKFPPFPSRRWSHQGIFGEHVDQRLSPTPCPGRTLAGQPLVFLLPTQRLLCLYLASRKTDWANRKDINGTSMVVMSVIGSHLHQAVDSFHGCLVSAIPLSSVSPICLDREEWTTASMSRRAPCSLPCPALSKQAVCKLVKSKYWPD